MSTQDADRLHRSSAFSRDDFAAVPYLRHGQSISLIHWSRVDGDWRFATILGEYVHRDECYWYLVIQGANVRLDRAEWAIFS